MNVSSRAAIILPVKTAPAVWIAVAILTALALANVYRAWTQSVVYDEAFTYLAFLSKSPSGVLTSYTGNNHVLFSLLARLSIGMFGLSELTLRLPSVLAGVVYFSVVFALCRLVFGNGLLFLITVAALSLNPFILDLLSAARGYGLALAFFVIALHQLTRSLVADPIVVDRRWLIASLALGLSVSASLTFVSPAVAVGIVALGMGAGSRRQQPFVPLEYVRRAAFWLCGPGLCVVAALLAVPLRHAKREDFSFGASTLMRATQSLLEASLRHDHGAWPVPSADVAPTLVIRVIAWAGVVPTMLIVAGVVCVLIARTVSTEGRRHPSEDVDQFVLLIGATLVATLLLLVGAHAFLNVPYPFARTGLYFIVLFILAMASLIRKVGQSSWRARKALTAIGLAVLVLLVGRFASEFNTAYYYEWRYDGGTRAIFDIIARWPRDGESGTVQVAASQALFSPTLNFYRVARGNGLLAPIGDAWEPGQWDYDFFVVSPGRHLDLTRRTANVVYVHPDSGAVLLVKRERRGAIPPVFR